MRCQLRELEQKTRVSVYSRKVSAEICRSGCGCIRRHPSRGLQRRLRPVCENGLQNNAYARSDSGRRELSVVPWTPDIELGPSVDYLCSKGFFRRIGGASDPQTCDYHCKESGWLRGGMMARVSQQVSPLLPAGGPSRPGRTHDADGGVVFVAGLVMFTFAVGDALARRLAAHRAGRSVEVQRELQAPAQRTA